MAASNNSKPASDDVAITSIPQADIEELTGGTVRETNTAYEDRTANPTEPARPEYEFVEETLAGGSILTTYNAPVGGFPEAE